MMSRFVVLCGVYGVEKGKYERESGSWDLFPIQVALENLEDMYLACCKGEVSKGFKLQAHKISKEPSILCVDPQKHKLIIFMINLVWFTI